MKYASAAIVAAAVFLLSSAQAENSERPVRPNNDVAGPIASPQRPDPALRTGRLRITDSTPPTLVWNIYNFDTRANTDYPGSPTLNASRGASYRIMLKAHDPEGLRQIQLIPRLGAGEIAWTCGTSGGGRNIEQQHTAELRPMTQNLSPSGNVVRNIFLIMNINLAMPCPSGWSFHSGAARLTGGARNYSGGAAAAVLKLKVAQ